MIRAYNGKIQREREQRGHNTMVTVGLWCHLRNLAREIKGGDTSKLAVFHEMIRYAPREMAGDLLEELPTL